LTSTIASFPSILVSLAFLFGITAQFAAMDGYSLIRNVFDSLERRVGAVYGVAVVVCVFSPFILNDVVIIILTPVIANYAKRFRIDVAPLLVAEVTLTNIASSLTPMGNPQNILLWAATGVSFGQFISLTWLPIVVSAALALLALSVFGRRSRETDEDPAPVVSWTPLVYLVLVALTIVLASVFGFDPAVPLGAGFLIGFIFTFRSPRNVLAGFDYRSLTTLYIFVGVVTGAAVLLTPSLAPVVQPVAAETQPYSAIFVGTVSNVISNFPATQLILSTVHLTQAAAPKVAVEAGLAGNLTPVGSIANLLALQMARREGLRVRRAILLQLAVGALSFLPAFL
jgi:Na+/H+ antiporter NhaD/arsenite permease-like protein